MRNIIIAVKRLQQLPQKGLSAQQKELIKTLLNALHEQKKNPKIHELKQIKELVLAEMTGSNPTSKLYLDCLNEVSMDITVVIESAETIKNPTNERVKRLQVFNGIYQETASKYNGKLVLPLFQSADARLGDAEGVCFGYVIEWLGCMLNGKKPFGINPLNPPYFKPIKYSKPVLNSFPGVNHVIPLRDDIFDLQEAQGSPEKLLSKISQDSPKGFAIASESVRRLRYFSNPKAVAVDMLDMISNYPNQYFMLSMNSNHSGHAMGFGRDANGTYHFLDANGGWFTFESKNDIERWLPFYFKKMGYTDRYHSYEVSSYQLTEKNSLRQTWNAILSFLADMANTYVYVLATPFNFLSKAIRSFRKIEEIDVGSDAVEELRSDEPSYSKDDSYQQLPSGRSNCDSSYSTLCGLLDISAEDLEAARKQALKNPEFKVRVTKNSPADLPSPRNKTIEEPLESHLVGNEGRKRSIN
ncbi:hypothetical protein EAS68_02360 [Legionella jordanis]|uniref:YopT-type cysteine protease domain-containing protein n=1 Tax=Legionella jordanis TaxID=456 RepID=UPI000F007589|nr:YopT-type cysteine protease domain-containing protein [Legionella jordanis]RMX21620.1 hypothetical protein EAS68_02360 [Legionella jordanis]